MREPLLARSPHRLPLANAPAATKPLRGALIGCGFFGRIQHEAWGRVEGARIVAACDTDLKRAQEIAPLAFQDPESLLNDVELDFVDIATRPDSHLALIQLALARRIPIICQKPLADSLDDARAILGLAATSSVPVMIHENWRWQPWFREAKRLIDGGAIGQPLCYHFRIRQRDGMGSDAYPLQPYFRQMPRLHVHETLVHSIDTARFLFGDIRSIYARLRRLNPQIAGEDRALLSLQHVNAIDGVVEGHRFLDPDPPGPAMGETMLEGDAGFLRILATGEIFLNGHLTLAPKNLPGYKGDSARAVQQHFIHCLSTGAEPESSVRNYWNTFAAVDAAYRSAESGSQIAIA
jgi:predicted dehydrogenase